nr:hypothetical protein TetV2_00566 [Oceanusvirus sp.]
MQRELIWYKDPPGLITSGNFQKIIPFPSMAYAEQLNAVLRLSLYYSVVVAFLRQNADVLVIPILVASVTYLLYSSFKREGYEAKTSDMQEGCVKPTKQNPFMNVLNSDSRTRKASCDPLDPLVKSKIDDEFGRSIFRDVDDVWERNNAGRTFYTTASTTIPNDQMGFAEWLYSGTRAGGKQTRPPRNAVNTM